TLGCTTQPLRGWKPCFDLPRVAADGNPGLHDATPSGLETLFRFTQGSRGRQPWAARRNPFRVGNLVSIYPGKPRRSTLVCTTQPVQVLKRSFALPSVAAHGIPGLHTS